MDINRFKSRGKCLWELPAAGPMRVPGFIFADRQLLQGMEDKVGQQLVNVAALPGIVRASMAMPDAHWGYGFLIGGVAAFDPGNGGIISVGGVGYDISCGVRCMRLSISRQEILSALEYLIDELFRAIPVGVGSTGKLKLSMQELDEVLEQGAEWAVKRGFGRPDDLAFIEEHGRLAGADPSKVSTRARERQLNQMGTLGSGNHYLEIQYVGEIYDEAAAQAFGLQKDQVVISIHCGSRALGHQIGTDYIQVLGKAAKKYRIPIRERELVCAPIESPEGQSYYSAMACGVNCALANRQVLGHMTEQVLRRVLPGVGCRLIYDVSHNTCKKERHMVNGILKTLYVHRKGATRAFGPGHQELPAIYKAVGQPVFIGGSMGTCSFVLAGTERSGELAWNSACHGAGRAMSRRSALKRWKGRGVLRSLGAKGIIVRAASLRGVAEEAPGAYKDVRLVVDVTHRAGLARKVAMLKPMAVIKG